MSENEMSQQQRDAAVIAAMREGLPLLADIEDASPSDAERATILRHIIHAALREIDRLRDELARAYTDLADMHEGEGYYNDAKRYRARAAALASADRDGAGTAAGDATAGDGDGGGES